MESRYVKVILRWIWILLLLPVLAGVLGFLLTNNDPPSYRATTRVIIGPGINSPNPSLDSLRTGALLMNTYAELAETETFRKQVLTELDLDLTSDDLAEIVDIRPIVDTQVLNITVINSDADTTVAIANQIADQLVELSPSAEYNSFLRTTIERQADRIEQDIANAEQRLTDLNTELQDETDSARQSLLTQRIADEENHLAGVNESLANLLEMLQRPFTNQVEIVDRAEVAVEASPQLALILLVSVGTGVVISAILAVGLVYLSSLMVDYETLSQHIEYPLWVHLQKEVKASNYRILSTFFLHLQKKNNVNSILLAGVEDSRHVARMACALAVTLSQTGKKVLLVDADFSNTLIAEQFKSVDSVNLIDTLTSDIVKLQAEHATGYPNLKVLPSGESTADAFYLIASPRLQRVLTSLEDSVDYIIVSGPALSSFAASMAIATWVDGGVIIAKQGKTRVKDLHKAISYLESVGGKVQGVVVSE
jgi:capsular polysaccharide biosynthesis protein